MEIRILQKGVPKPLYCYDKYASILGNDDVRNLAEFETDWHDGIFENIVIDLPCSVEAPSTKSRFDVSTHFSSLPELLQEHEKMLRLAYRKMLTGGILVYKTMDFTYCGSPYWLSDEVLRMATEIGFELADKYIYIDPKHSKIDRRRTRFTASVPAHAYFFVFRKSEIKWGCSFLHPHSTFIYLPIFQECLAVNQNFLKSNFHSFVCLGTFWKEAADFFVWGEGAFE